MKAIQANEFGDAGVLKLVELDTPEPGPGQVRVRIAAAGVNPVEVYIRNGGYPAYTPPLPYTPGLDAAGTIDALGPGVTGFTPGDRVWVAAKETGTYAEYGVYPTEWVRPLPENVTFEQGASVGVPGLAAHRAIFSRGGVQAAEKVLIHGASGAVGYLAAQFAKAAGASVVGTAGSAEGLDAIRALGVEAVDHSDKGHYAAIKQLTGGVDLIVEMLANENLVDDFEVLAKYGRIVVVGNRGSLDFNPRLLMGKDADVRGLATWNFPPDLRNEALDAITARLANGSLVPLVGKSFPLAEAGAAQDHVMTSKALGKVVLTV